MIAAAAMLVQAGPYPRPVDTRYEIAYGQDPHQSMTVGTATAQRGQKAYGVLKVPAGSDAGYDIPVAVLHGARPGPVLAIVSGAHGTEYASIVAVQELIDAVKPAELSGTLILVPLVNVPSFEKLTPHVNPTDNKSMNSRYPGDPAGTQTDRASAVITKEVVEQSDHLGRRWIDDVNGRGRGRVDEVAVDIELVRLHGGQAVNYMQPWKPL